eukprot:TRINITY_DN2843_c0_g2_i3.p1 TRINITY_DN2843_c0_g2~~TRINITY_DN2843_c0_g2_i3.p1  ORF type:complete len:171 (-),score=30.93 TRINITY_DN2843_c0_g2_i3:142-654(-)
MAALRNNKQVEACSSDSSTSSTTPARATQLGPVIVSRGSDFNAAAASTAATGTPEAARRRSLLSRCTKCLDIALELVLPAMIPFLVALVLTAFIIGVGSSLGLMEPTGEVCRYSSGYGGCERWQDLRAIVSVALGVMFCCLVFGEGSTQEEGGEALAQELRRGQFLALFL